MGVLSAITKSVGGLNAQSFALENISGNIANSQTTGYKRVDTSFQSLVASEGGRVESQSAGNVRATARATNDIGGAINSDANETSMAIQGDGYFVIRQKTGEIDGISTFSTENVYSRRGDFTLNNEGYMVNGSGYYLAGLALDPTTGNPIGDAVELINIDNKGVAAEKTGRIDYTLNLPKSPITPYVSSGGETDTWGGIGGDVNTDVTYGDVDDFLQNSISGSALTVYDSTGTPVNVQFRWAKTADQTWSLFYQSDAATTTDTDTVWSYVGEYTFTTDGKLDTLAPAGGVADATATSITIPDLTVNGSLVGDIKLEHGATRGVTQYYNANGTTTIRNLTQDGLPAGDFVDLSISDQGHVVANYSNGKAVPIYAIPLVSFAGDSALRRLDGEAFAATKESGPAISGASGSIIGASLEASNVDLGDEFTKLIVTQQAFSANSRAISTANDMLSEVLNIVR